jgi:hypothetical protein
MSVLQDNIGGASILFGAGWENDSVEVLWRDSGRTFCRLWRNDAEGEKHAFIPIPAGVEHPTLENVNRPTHEHGLKSYRCLVDRCPPVRK